MPDTPRHVVIIGCGFGGLYAARALRRAPVRITIIDRENHHCFQPLLYEVATAALSAVEVAEPIRRIFSKQRNVEVLLGEVTDIDVEQQQVILSDGAVTYDFLIVAAGASHSYFGHDDWEPHAPGLKTIHDALEIRRRFLLAFESAEREADETARQRELTFVVVGGGPTGVELAGTMSEIARRAIPRDFRHIDTRTARVILLEAQDRILPTFDPGSSAAAQKHLEDLGVDVRTNTMVTAVDAEGVRAGDERLHSHNVYWAAGVQASPLGRALGAETDKRGRVVVQRDLSIAEHREVFVIGDLAKVDDPDTGDEVPGIAPAAIQMGKYVADLIERETSGRSSADQRRPFRYVDKGMLATIGRARAVGRVFNWHVKGWLAWLLWAFVHIFYLIGFRNRIIAMLRWAWAYVVFQRGARIIAGDPIPRPRLRQPRERPESREEFTTDVTEEHRELTKKK